MGATKRCEGLRRALALWQRLQGLRYAPSLAELADQFNVTTRTIRRDLELLESVGLDVPKWRLNEQLMDLRANTDHRAAQGRVDA